MTNKTQYKSHKTLKGFSAQSPYLNQVLAFQLAVTMGIGVFVMWGANTYMNVQMQQPTCNCSKVL
jgi:hypothetical protein